MHEGSRNEKSEQSVGLLAVLLPVTQYASAVTSYLSV